MAKHPTSRPRSPRGRRGRPRAVAHQFSQEVADLGATTASLPHPVRRGVLQWLRQLLALFRLGRQVCSPPTPAPQPPDRQSGGRAEQGHAT